MPSLIIKTGGTYTMSGKYMKIKRVIIPTITMLVIASQLFGCASASKKDAYNMLQESAEIELEYAVPDYDSNTEESKVELLPWLKLSSLDTHPELRLALEKLMNITGETGNKEGILYYNLETQSTDQNTTLYMATKNTVVSSCLDSDAYMSEIGKIAPTTYTDIEEDDSIAPYAVLNAYFELLPDQEEGQFDGDATISRAQAMALVMRATTPVNESQAPDEDADFTKAVGETQYTNFAAPMDEYAYLNTSTGLNEQSFNGTMTKGEFIYLVTDYIHADYMKTLENYGYHDLYSDTSDVVITTVSDAGNIKYSEAITDACKGVPSDMYNTFKVAIKNKYIDEDSLSEWDEAITKGEAIFLFMEMALNYTQNAGSPLINAYQPTTNAESTEEYLSESDEISHSKWAEINGAWDAVHQYELYAQENGADYAMGWSWCYLNGKAAGDSPSYAIYMKEGDPLYGTVFHVGDYLPSGTQFCGTGEEYKAMLGQGIHDQLEEMGVPSYTDESGDTIFDLDAYNAQRNK